MNVCETVSENNTQKNPVQTQTLLVVCMCFGCILARISFHIHKCKFDCVCVCAVLLFCILHSSRFVLSDLFWFVLLLYFAYQLLQLPKHEILVKNYSSLWLGYIKHICCIFLGEHSLLDFWWFLSERQIRHIAGKSVVSNHVFGLERKETVFGRFYEWMVVIDFLWGFVRRKCLWSLFV